MMSRTTLPNWRSIGSTEKEKNWLCTEKAAQGHFLQIILNWRPSSRKPGSRLLSAAQWRPDHSCWLELKRQWKRHLEAQHMEAEGQCQGPLQSTKCGEISCRKTWKEEEFMSRQLLCQALQKRLASLTR